MLQKKPHEVVGNILDAEQDIVAHSVNCKGVMGAGLAKQLRVKYPEMYSQYKRKCNAHKLNSKELLGDVDYYFHDPHKTGTPLKVIASIFGQDGYGRDKKYTDEDAIISGLGKIAGFMRRTKKTLALPYKMGCGLGGGNWGTIRGALESYTGGSPHNKFTYIYKLEKDT